MLRALYEGTEAKVADQRLSKREINRIFHHTPANERIMLLGHGSDKGLFSRTDDTQPDCFDRLLVYHPHAYYLRRHGPNLVGVWCHADLFARREGLHGLFSGMIVTEMSEADQYQVDTTPQELAEENVRLFRRLRLLLDEGVPFTDIPGRLQAMDEAHTSLTNFNYSYFYCL